MTLLRGMLLAAAAAAVAQDPPRFSVKVDVVQVDVQVARRGRPVAGLGPADFEVRDNGVVQKIERVTREEMPLDLSLVVDASHSVAGERLSALAAAARDAVNALAPQDRSALLTFSHRLAAPARFASDRAAVLDAIDRMTASGATSLFDAVYAALLLRHASSHRALIIVFTDGQDTSSWLPPAAVLDIAQQTDAVVYIVALTTGGSARASITFPSLRSDQPSTIVGPAARGVHLVTTEFMQELAAVTGGRVLDTADPGNLRKLFTQAVREMKTRYVLSYTPEGVPRAGWHALSVKLTKHHGEVTARRGYFVLPERE